MKRWLSVLIPLLLLRLLLMWHASPVVVYAQDLRCDQNVAITLSAGGTATIASAVPSRTIYICGWMLTADNAGASYQFKSGSTNLTGAMLTVLNTPMTMPVSSEAALIGIAGSSVLISSTTANIFGFVMYSQR